MLKDLSAVDSVNCSEHRSAKGQQKSIPSVQQAPGGVYPDPTFEKEKKTGSKFNCQEKNLI